MLIENEASIAGCQAQITRLTDDILGPDGISTRTSCQRCEVFIIHKTANSTSRDILSADNSLNIVLQNCPKLIEEGYLAGQIPRELLPKVSESK